MGTEESFATKHNTEGMPYILFDLLRKGSHQIRVSLWQQALVEFVSPFLHIYDLSVKASKERRPTYKRKRYPHLLSALKSASNKYRHLPTNTKKMFYSSVSHSRSPNPCILWNAINRLLHRNFSTPPAHFQTLFRPDKQPWQSVLFLRKWLQSKSLFNHFVPKPQSIDSLPDATSSLHDTPLNQHPSSST